MNTERKPTVETIITKSYETEKVNFYNRLFEKTLEFEIYGQTPERSYEDRNVYFNFCNNPSGWLDGEQAIELGLKLIEHGKKALYANMVQHQMIHQSSCLERYCKEGIVEKLIFRCIDETPANYGTGFKTFRIMPIWKENKAPKYNKEFCFDKVIYFSPFEEEFKKQTEQYIAPIEFENYNREDEVNKFKEACKACE